MKRPKFTTFKIADVSTAHITAKDAMMMCDPQIPGFIASVSEGAGEMFAVFKNERFFKDQLQFLKSRGFSSEFIALFQHLHDQNIPYVRIDSISEEVEGLPRFYW